MEKVFSILPKESTHDIYSIDGRLIRKNTTLNDALRTLPKGIYVINGSKFVIEWYARTRAIISNEPYLVLSAQITNN